MPADLQWTLSYATETSVSSWLTSLPVEEHGFALHKEAFAYIMGGILPSLCAHSKNFTVELVQPVVFRQSGIMSCIRSLPLSCQSYAMLSSKLLGRLFHLLWLMLKMVHICMLLHMVCGGIAIRRCSWMLRSLEVPQTEEEGAEEIWRACLWSGDGITPLIFSTFGGMFTICRLASLLTDKKDVNNSVILSWLYCCILCHWVLVRSSVIKYFRGCPANLQALHLAISEGQLTDRLFRDQLQLSSTLRSSGRGAGCPVNCNQDLFSKSFNTYSWFSNCFSNRLYFSYPLIFQCAPSTTLFLDLRHCENKLTQVMMNFKTFFQ